MQQSASPIVLATAHAIYFDAALAQTSEEYPAKSDDGVSKSDTLPDTATEKETEERQMTACMAGWDAGAHMTKAQWRNVCKRQIKETPGIYSGAR